jgi:hypothetical protein
MSFSHCFPCCLVISRLVNLLHRQNKLPIISFFTQDKIEKKWVVAIDNTNNNTDNMDNVDNMDNMENTEQKKKNTTKFYLPLPPFYWDNNFLFGCI